MEEGGFDGSFSATQVLGDPFHRMLLDVVGKDHGPLARAGTHAPVPGRTATLDRTRLWAMETPQVFARDLIIRAYARVQRFGLRITDDVQAVEGLGLPVTFLENPHPNPKLTTPADLAYMEFLLGCPARPSP